MSQSNIDFALGVVAGEGCFTLGTKRAHGKVYPNPTAVVKVKEHDREMIQTVQDAFEDAGMVFTNAGQVVWQVNGKEDLMYMVEKIRAYAPDVWWDTEKAQNFETWAEIVEIYCDGLNTSEDAVQMFELAKDGLNQSNGSDVDWDEYITLAKENSYGHVCGEEKADGGECQRGVSGPDETCWDH